MRVTTDFTGAFPATPGSAEAQAEFRRYRAERLSECVGIGNRRGIDYGVVYAGETGRKIGRVFSTTRRLRGTGGQSGRAWTANVSTGYDSEVGGSLGTRYATRWAAARALVAFHQSYPDSGVMDRAALGRAVACFKYDNPEVCGLTRRYRGADPRAVRRVA